MERFYWTGYCNKNRFQALPEIEKIIGSFGYILDFKEFSDISISMIVEVEQQKIAAFYESLQTYLKLNHVDFPTTASTDDCVVLLHISFTSGSGTVRKEVPASE